MIGDVVVNAQGGTETGQTARQIASPSAGSFAAERPKSSPAIAGFS